MKLRLFTYFFFFFFIFSFFASGVIDSQDGFLYLSVARSMYYNRDITAPVDEYDTKTKTGKNILLGTYVGKNGKTYSRTGIGYSVALLPAVALTDLVYKVYNINPPEHFPLESDWLILFLASFTNAFFGSALSIILFLYLNSIGLSIKQSSLLSLGTILATNLWVYTKHSLAHMMFITFLTLSFFLIKKYSQTKKPLLLILSGLSFGILTITYNQTFILAMPALVIYYLLLLKRDTTLSIFVKTTIRDLLLFSLMVSPFLLTLSWIETIRASQINYGDPLALTTFTLKLFRDLPLGVIFEGIFGQLFSPGRSFFLYSPILLIPIFFWHKIKSNIKPEVIIFILIGLLYIVFMTTQYDIGKEGQGYVTYWHGESSWGPRYLTPLIPFGILIIGSIYQYLNKKQKYFIFIPLLIIGFYINFLGIIMPYQIKFHNLDKEFYVNAQQYTNSSYINLLPRYTPIVSMSNNLVKLVQNFPKTLDHGMYNVKFYDGIDFPFNVGPERWRVIENKGYISFDENVKDPVKELTFGVINHPLAEASESAVILNFNLNGENLDAKASLVAKERSIIRVPIKSTSLRSKDNQLVIDAKYDDPTVFPQKKQLLGLISMSINNTTVNLESLNFPFISKLGPPMGFQYKNYGNIISTPWKGWEIHTQIFERTPDFWWIKPLFYWDLPKNLFLGIFILNIIGLVFFAAIFFNQIKKTR